MEQYFEGYGWIVNLIDILIVSYVIYRIILLIKGTRAAQMLIGMGFIFLAFLTAERFELITLQWILNNFLSSIVLVIIILFQNDIRRGLAQVGRNPFFSSISTLESFQNLEEVIKASVLLAGKKIGALIVLEREIGLKDYVEIGTNIDSKISKEIFISIFQTSSPLHDGAVIIQKGRISFASCFLPLTLNPNISKDLGSRHRAAIGLTEETDAVVIIVSEETGKISIVKEGVITRDLDGVDLRRILNEIFFSKKRQKSN